MTISELICYAVYLQISAYFDFELKQIEQLSDKSHVDFTGLKIRRDGQERKIIGNITYKTDLDNSYTAESTFYVKQGGEYRKLPYRVPIQGFCDYLQGDIYFYPEWTKYSDLPFPPPCPFPKVIDFLK